MSEHHPELENTEEVIADECDDGDDDIICLDDVGGVYVYEVPEKETGMRLDAVLAQKFDDISRMRLKEAIKDGQVKVGGRAVTKPAYKLEAGDSIRLEIQLRNLTQVEPEDIPLDVVYEDEHLIVINKQVGLVVHPGAGNPSGTLVNALKHHCGDNIASIGAPLRPGIVHRLDKDTSGLMVAAKTDRAYYRLAEQLADRSLTRIYKALVWGVPDIRKGAVDQPIGRHNTQRHKMAVNWKQGKQARTKYTVLEAFDPVASLIECQLETGRTHQIRVHMTYQGFPLIGDQQYGAQPTAIKSKMNRADITEEAQDKLMALPHQALQASRISFIHPETEERMEFEIPMASYLEEILNLIKTTN